MYDWEDQEEFGVQHSPEHYLVIVLLRLRLLTGYDQNQQLVTALTVDGSAEQLASC